MARKKRTIKNIEITGIADKGMGVGRSSEGQVVFVEESVPGDIVDALIRRKKKGVPFGSPIHYHKLSEFRVEPFCLYFGECGGCKWQNLNYSNQLAFKEQNVKDAFARIAQVSPDEFLPIIGCEDTKYFRNKLEFTFTHRRWLTEKEIKESDTIDERRGLGFHKPGAFDKILDIDTCYLQEEPSNDLRNFIRRIAIENNVPFYNIRSHEGLLRTLTIRTNSDGEAMLILAMKENDDVFIEKLQEELNRNFPQVISFYLVINNKKNDSLFDLDHQLIYGVPILIDQIGFRQYQIGPKSFFQTNTKQAKVLFDVTREFADCKSSDIVWDLYCGLGSISLYVADDCNEVIGLEEIPEAIHFAKINMELNGVKNASFYCGDVKEVFDNNTLELPAPDVIITDPPRAGMHSDVVETLKHSGARRIVYVSCNPATQARDIGILFDVYHVRKVQPVDMFPHSHHIENIALLELR
jgi:23S rRNA (uracil1939-C5)-methyltransferase